MHIETVGKMMLKWAHMAIAIIRENAHCMGANDKLCYDGCEGDKVTVADYLAQAMYLREMNEHFPNIPVIAEENYKENGNVGNTYFTVDPLDGTKAYTRGESSGVGTMISFVLNGQIKAVVIGDANTGEIYYYADDDEYGGCIRHRFGRDDFLKPNTDLPLKKQYVQLREDPRIGPNLAQKLTHPKLGLFKDILVNKGSIGVFMARLWKGEIGAAILDPGYDTPWDTNPVIGISKRLGFIFIRLYDDGKIERFVPDHQTTVTNQPHYELVIHESKLKEFENWFRLG